MTPLFIICLMLVLVGTVTYAVAEWLASRLVRTSAKRRESFGDASGWYE
jgi:hypothetical protein